MFFVFDLIWAEKKEVTIFGQNQYAVRIHVGRRSKQNLDQCNNDLKEMTLYALNNIFSTHSVPIFIHVVYSSYYNYKP